MARCYDVCICNRSQGQGWHVKPPLSITHAIFICPQLAPSWSGLLSCRVAPTFTPEGSEPLVVLCVGGLL